MASWHRDGKDEMLLVACPVHDTLVMMTKSGKLLEAVMGRCPSCLHEAAQAIRSLR